MILAFDMDQAGLATFFSIRVISRWFSKNTVPILYGAEYLLILALHWQSTSGGRVPQFESRIDINSLLLGLE